MGGTLGAWILYLQGSEVVESCVPWLLLGTAIAKPQWNSSLTGAMKAQAWNSLMAEGLSETQNYVLKLRYSLVPRLMTGGTLKCP